jgi:hypothetical protein
MAVRSKSVTLSSGDGAKSLAEILGVTESWTHVFVTAPPSGYSVTICDSTGNGGLSIPSSTVREFVFASTDNPAEELFFMVSSAQPRTFNLLVY